MMLNIFVNAMRLFQDSLINRKFSKECLFEIYIFYIIGTVFYSSSGSRSVQHMCHLVDIHSNGKFNCGLKIFYMYFLGCFHCSVILLAVHY